MISGTYTAVLSDRASNVIRVGRIGEELATGAQTYFDDDVNFIGFDGRDPFSIGQRTCTRATSPARAAMVRTPSSAPTSSTSRSATSCRSLWGGEHTFKVGGGISFNQMPPRTTVDSGIFQFRTDAPYNPANPATYPFQFDVTVGPPSVERLRRLLAGPPLLLLRRGQVAGQQQPDAQPRPSLRQPAADAGDKRRLRAARRASRGTSPAAARPSCAAASASSTPTCRSCST